MILLLGTDTEPQGASLFNQDSIVELINLASPEGRCLTGADSTLQNASAGASGAPGLLAGIGKGLNQMEQDEGNWDLPWPLSSLVLWTRPMSPCACVCVLASGTAGSLRLPSLSLCLEHRRQLGLV